MSEQHQSSSSSRNPAFFNMIPPLRTYNIPKPVIQPPETGPCLFLNPNPHCDQVLEKLSPMEVDPCIVASRSEIVARTTDLSAAEQAGVPLSEPTMVLTNTEFPVTYDFSAPQTVNDTFVTKIHSEKAGLVVCDVSPEKPSPIVYKTLDQESKKTNNDQDLKNIQKLVVVPPIKQETQSLIANDASASSLFFCNIPPPGCDYQRIGTEQESVLLCKNASVSTTVVPPSKGGSQKGHAEPDPHQPLWCDVCKVSWCSNKCHEKHNVEKPHLKTSEKIPIPVTPPSTTPMTSMNTTPNKPHVEVLKSNHSEIVYSEDGKTAWCKTCKRQCNIGHDFIRHLSGKRHQKNLQKVEKIPNFPSNAIASVVTPPPNDPAEKPKLSEVEVVNPNQSNSKSIRCELCAISCTSISELNSHIAGKKHQKNVRITEKLSGNSPAALVANRSMQDQVKEEGKVVLLEGSKRKANGSLASEEDADIKRQKILMMKEEEDSNVSVICKECKGVFRSLMAFKTHPC